MVRAQTRWQIAKNWRSVRFVVALRVGDVILPAAVDVYFWCVRVCVCAGVLCVWEIPETSCGSWFVGRAVVMASKEYESSAQLLHNWLSQNASLTLLGINGTQQFEDTLVNATTPADLLQEEEQQQQQQQQQYIGAGLLLWLIINAIIFVFILVGNALTIVAVRTCRNLRSVISNIFILSLAISDFIVGIALPYHVVFYMGNGLDLGRLRGFCLFRFFLFICACCVSILTLISIAVDRYIAVMYALHYRR